MISKKTSGLFLVVSMYICGLPLCVKASSSVTLVEWTFPNNPDNATADGGTPENIAQSLSLVGATLPTYNNSGATTFSARATGWQNGQFQKYWQFEVDTRDYQHLTLSARQRSSSTGPRDFVVEYRTSTDTPWMAVPGGITTLADNFTNGTLEALPLPSEAANQGHLFIRFLMATNLSVSGGTVTSTGASRIDDIVVSGTLIHEPEDDSSTSLCSTISPLVTFNEIFPYAPTVDAEYIELANHDTACVDLSSWRIEDQNHHQYIIPGGTLAAPKQLLVFFKNFYMNNTSAETLYLYNANNEVVDHLSYDQAIKDFSYSFDGETFRFTSLITPGTTNTFDTDDTSGEDPDTTETSSLISINEFLPNPKGDEVSGEYIELQNNDLAPINLKGWSLIDASHKKFIFLEDTSVEPAAYLVVTRNTFRFPLNNFGTETLSLVDPLGKEVSRVSYTNPKEGFSYSLKKNSWYPTQHLTPGAANRFSKEPKIILKSPREGFTKTPILFEATLKRKSGTKKLSYRWDFGDGHGSTMETPRHTYQKKGTYPVTVRIKNNKVDVEKTFTVTIKNYPSIPLLITALEPNPKGKDADNEWIEIENPTEKIVDLKSWAIATGNDKESLTRHPIKESLFLEPHRTHRLTHAESAFSLNNQASLIELRSPDDDVISRAAYNEATIEEGVVCRNIKEVCDFPGTPSPKEDSEDSASQDTLPENQPSATLPSEVLGDAAVAPSEKPELIDTKEELLHRIRQDVNTLINLYIHDLVRK